MPSAAQISVMAAVLLGFVSSVSPAQAAAHDGNWSVLVTTEKGNCDRGFRYSVKVADGRVRYQGSASVGMNGTVTPNGAVQVDINSSGQGVAKGNGRLSANAGAGTWRSTGAGNGSACSGRWEAERR